MTSPVSTKASTPAIFSTHMLSIAIAVFVSLFAFISAMLFAGQLDAFDQKALTLLRAQASFDDPLGPAWMEEALRDVTALGSRVALGVIISVLSIFLVLQSRRKLASSFIAAALAVVFLNTVLKFTIDRPRPQIVEHEARVFSPSFPSAHAMESCSIFLIGAFLICFVSRCRGSMQVFTFSVAIFTIFAVGFSRMYLGVHYPSDIISGWLMGVVCAAAFILLAQRLHPA